MKFQMIHENYNVADLSLSLTFYQEALGLTEKRRITADDGSFIIVYVGNDTTDFELELTWLRDREEPYSLGDNEFHLAFQADNYEEAHALYLAQTFQELGGTLIDCQFETPHLKSMGGRYIDYEEYMRYVQEPLESL